MLAYIYDYFRKYGEYDNDSYAKDNDRHSEMVLSGGLYICELQDNAYEFADDHQAICTGFAQAFSWLCRQDGIECITVIGEHRSEDVSGKHSWNLVHLDGEWYMVDPTAAAGNYGKIEWNQGDYTELINNFAGYPYNFTYPAKLAN